MRTNIVIDEKLINSAKKASGAKTKKQVVEDGLKLLIQMDKQSQIRKFRGKLTWKGDLGKMRND